MTTAKDTFRLSRIRAEGWNAARRISPIELDDADEAKCAALNPYANDPERDRWSDGFKSAVAARKR
jgi:hypothetical protein